MVFKYMACQKVLAVVMNGNVDQCNRKQNYRKLCKRALPGWSVNNASGHRIEYGDRNVISFSICPYVKASTCYYGLNFNHNQTLYAKPIKTHCNFPIFVCISSVYLQNDNFCMKNLICIDVDGRIVVRSRARDHIKYQVILSLIPSTTESSLAYIGFRFTFARCETNINRK